MKKIDFIKLIKQQKERNIPWCNGNKGLRLA